MPDAGLYLSDEPLMVISGGTRLTAIADTGLPNLVWLVDRAKPLAYGRVQCNTKQGYFR